MSDTSSQSDSNCTPELHQEIASCISEDNNQDTEVSDLEKGEAPEPSKGTETAATSSKKAPQCHFFKKAGKCRYGDRCRFAHEIAQEPQKEEEPGAESGPEVEVQPQTQTHAEKPPSGEAVEVCRFYTRSGWCRNGKRCRFLHQKMKATASTKQEETDADSQEVTTEGVKDAQKKSMSDVKLGDGKKKEKPKKMCRYFKAGHCNAGDGCKFLHPMGEGSSEPKPSSQAKPKSKEPGTAMARPNIIQEEAISMKIANLSGEDLKKLRGIEITQLKKRFPEDQMTVVEAEGAETVYRVTVNPTDPDWPYDMKDFEIEVMFPASYPMDPFTVSMPEDQVLPNTVLNYMHDSIGEWVLARHDTNRISGKVELMFRPFLRWLDRSLERLFTDAAKQFKKVADAKAAGIELVPYGKQKPAEPRDIQQYTDINHPRDAHTGPEGVTTTQETHTNNDEDKESDTPSADIVTEQTPSDGHDKPENTNIYADLFNVQRRGIEIKFSKLALSESISTLVAHTIGVTVQCSRCKNPCDVVTPPKRLNMARCGKCQHQQLVTYRQSLIHHFTATLGFLDLEGCMAFDLILAECEFALGCLNCSEETKVQGLQFGQVRATWCQKCHTKMTLELETAIFQHLQVQAVKMQGTKAHVIQVKQLRNQAHPDIHEGSPLPEQGTCKHFKKSFRWFRFPCCGKCYPCDECHNESEPDHEMNYATRMICGFCCKEQQFSPDKPCISCQSLTTKSKTSHWEGGMGCRNKTKMSKNDKQKYVSANKTTSRKQQNLQTDKNAK